MTRLDEGQVGFDEISAEAGFGRIVPGDARHSLFHRTDKDGKVKRVSPSTLAHAQEAILAYRKSRNSVTLNVAWEVLCRLWTIHAVPDKPDLEGPLYKLCYQFAYALEAEGYDPDQDDDEDILELVACHLYDHLPADREFLDFGSFDDGSGHLAVDLISGKVIVSDQPMQQTIRREEPKVGRNDPCPCGSGKKYKRCGRIGLCGADQPAPTYPNLLG